MARILLLANPPSAIGTADPLDCPAVFSHARFRPFGPTPLVSLGAAFLLHRLRGMLHGGARIRVGESGRARSPGESARDAAGGLRAVVYSGGGCADEPGGARQRRLRLLRPHHPPLPGLCGPPPAVPHVALLAVEPANSGKLGGGLPGVPRGRLRAGGLLGRDRRTGGSDTNLRAASGKSRRPLEEAPADQYNPAFYPPPIGSPICRARRDRRTGFRPKMIVASGPEGPHV